MADDWTHAPSMRDLDATLADYRARFINPAVEALLARWRAGTLEPGDVEMLIWVLQGPSTTRVDERDPRT